MSNCSIWPIDFTLSSATILGQSGPGSNFNEGVLCIPHSSSITGALPFDFFASYPEMQSEYSTEIFWACTSWKIFPLVDKLKQVWFQYLMAYKSL